MSARDLWATALHEAGHAVIAQCWNFQVHHIRMSSACPAYTAVRFPFTPDTLTGAYLESPWGVSRAMQGIVQTLMAGAMAEGALLLGHDFHLITLWKPSWQRLRSRLAVQDNVPVTQASTLALAHWDALCQEALEEARTVLSAPVIQQALSALAGALVQAGQLDAPAISALLRRMPAGRPPRKGAESWPVPSHGIK